MPIDLHPIYFKLTLLLIAPENNVVTIITQLGGIGLKDDVGSCYFHEIYSECEGMH